MFCTSLGVSSIQINGDPKRQLGKPWENSCPVTLYFDQGETVTSMYALAKGSKDAFMIQGPYLLVSFPLSLLLCVSEELEESSSGFATNCGSR